MSRLAYRLRGSADDVLTVELSGFVNASTIPHFEEILGSLEKKGARRIVLDFYHVNYINSTGIGAILGAHESLGRSGGSLVVVRVPQEVGLTMHLLGLTKVVPFLKSKADALAYFRGSTDVRGTYGELPPAPAEAAAAAAASTVATSPDKTASGRRAIYFYKTDDFRPRPDGSAVLMVVPKESVFTDVLRMRLSTPKGRIEVATTPRDALALMEQFRPDLLILEHTVAGSEDFLSRVKTDRERSLCSILKVYPHGTEVERLREFKIWENDFLVEPFDVSELFALADAELRRVPKDRRAYLQQVHFQFRGRPENLAKAHDLADALVKASGLDPEAATALTAAFREAVDNALRHGHGGDPGKVVDVVFLLDREQVIVTVEDSGEGFDYEPFLAAVREKKAPAEASRERRGKGGRGGLGILLMAKCSDKLEYLGKGNIVRLVKRLKAPPGGNGQGKG
ncbi:MAG: ATP-binding protein [Planctomycetales bacterium]|nr:ATP-binding protein [Planctomycetales bacterium]